MPRKPAILISLILLLVASGAGMTWLFHLRERALTGSEEYLTRELTAPLVCGHWQPGRVLPSGTTFRLARGWLSPLRGPRAVSGREDYYVFTHQDTGGTTMMTVLSEEGKIVSLGFTGAPGDRVAFQDDFFGKYPQFRKYHPETSPLAAAPAP